MISLLTPYQNLLKYRDIYRENVYADKSPNIESFHMFQINANIHLFCMGKW